MLAAVSSHLQQPTVTPSMAAAQLAPAEWGSVKAVLVGSGSDGMGGAGVAEHVLALAAKPSPTVLYIGTPTYDLPGPKAAQTTVFAEAGCVITELNLVQPEISFQPLEEAAETIRAADIILVR